MARRLIAAIALVSAGAAGAEVTTDCTGTFCVQTDRTETRVVLTGINREPVATVSVAVDVRLRNMRMEGDPRAVVGPREARRLAVLVPGGQGLWSFEFDYAVLPGDFSAVHDARNHYDLPYTAGAWPVVQGCGGVFSHRGVADDAVDFAMPEGTPVVAARGGRVAIVRDDSRTGGRARRNLGRDNRVIVAHDDGTMGVYAHLAFGTAAVVPGQTVQAGDLLARSGNTGLSTAPHLHFEVYSPRPDGGRRTWPIPFRHSGGTVICPPEGARLRR